MNIISLQMTKMAASQPPLEGLFLEESCFLLEFWWSLLSMVIGATELSMEGDGRGVGIWAEETKMIEKVGICPKDGRWSKFIYSQTLVLAY